MPRNVKMTYPKLGRMMDKAEDDQLVKRGLWVKITREEREILKEADAIETLFFALEELALGNREMEVVFTRAWSYMQDAGWGKMTDGGRKLAMEAGRRFDERK